MIASEIPVFTRRLDSPQPVSLEHAVCCAADAEFAVGAILSAMGSFPFGVSDALAVQLGVRETLSRSLPAEDQRGTTAKFHVRTSLTSASVRVQIDDVSESEAVVLAADRLRWGQLPAEFRQRLQLAKTYMTSVDVHQQGRQIVLSRARGQGFAVSALPAGYDFQI